MSKDSSNASVGQTGNADDLINNAGPSVNGGNDGESAMTNQPSTHGDNLDDASKKSYEESQKQVQELEKKLGEQGSELGEFRTFFKDVGPLLDTLQEQPELVEAIMDGKVDSSLANAVLENKVKIEDAAKVTEAHQKVKDDLGDTEYGETSKKDLEKMITDKVNEMEKRIGKSNKNDIKSSEDKRKFEESVDEFVQNTDDFSEYAEKINEWLEENPSVYDIKTAYYAVKGIDVSRKKAEENKISKAEAAKNLAANAAGGGSQGASIVSGEDAADSLIANSANPNAF